MTKEDWAAIQESGFNFDLVGGFEKFLNMTYDQ
jgi:hypothetical protein